MGWGLGGEGRGCSKEGVVWRASCWGGGGGANERVLIY